MNRCVITLFVFLLVLSCAKRQSRVAPDSPGSQKGEVSFEFLVEPGSEKKEDPQGWEFRPPRFSGEPVLPVYPERALVARFGSATVVVRIVIGVDGGVSEVSQRPGSTPGPFAEDFRQAVEAAVRAWKFTPASWWLLGDGKDLNGDGKPDYQKVVSTHQVPVYLDVEFDFEIVGGRGKVRSTAGSRGRVTATQPK